MKTLSLRYLIFFVVVPIRDNKVKQFNVKMIHISIASKENVCIKWEMVNTNLCNTRGKVDATLYFLLHCKDVIMF